MNAETKPLRHPDAPKFGSNKTRSVENIGKLQEQNLDCEPDENSNRSESSGDRKSDCISGNFKYPEPKVDRKKLPNLVKSNTTCLACDIFRPDSRPEYMREATDVLELEDELVQKEFQKNNRLPE